MSYEVVIHPDAAAYLNSLDEKSRRICRENLLKLESNPYPRPGSGSGDKEKLVFEGEQAYRLHIGRSHTAIYRIFEEQAEVRIYEVMDIDEAHKRYGF